jgi:SRSO17 transposase
MLLWPARRAGQLPGRGNAVVSSSSFDLPVAYHLYLPKEWAEDGERLQKAGVPDDIALETNTDIALAQAHWA